MVRARSRKRPFDWLPSVPDLWSPSLDCAVDGDMGDRGRVLRKRSEGETCREGSTLLDDHSKATRKVLVVSIHVYFPLLDERMSGRRVTKGRGRVRLRVRTWAGIVTKRLTEEGFLGDLDVASHLLEPGLSLLLLVEDFTLETREEKNSQASPKRK